jgi:chromosome segregation ATPase
MGKHLQLIGTIVPLLIVAVGLIGFVLTLRSDITAAQAQMVELRRELQLVSQSSRQTEIDINKLNKLIEDFDEIEAITEEVDVLIFRIDELTEEVGSNSPAIEKLKTGLAIANDQMNTIMADHAYMGDMLSELGKSQPSGERRSYGGYAGY